MSKCSVSFGFLFLFQCHKVVGIQVIIHFGHRYRYEHRRLEKAAREVSMTQKEFNDYVNSRPNYFQLENAKENMSHRNEKPGVDDIKDIKQDMINFLKERGLR